MKQNELIPGKYYTWPGVDHLGYLFVGWNLEGCAVFDFGLNEYHTAKRTVLETKYELVPQEKTVWINVYKGDVSATFHSSEEYAKKCVGKIDRYLGTFPFTYKE